MPFKWLGVSGLENGIFTVTITGNVGRRKRTLLVSKKYKIGVQSDLDMGHGGSAYIGKRVL